MALGAVVFSPDIYIGYNAIVLIKLGLYPYPWVNIRHYVLPAAAADYMFTYYDRNACVMQILLLICPNQLSVYTLGQTRGIQHHFCFLRAKSLLYKFVN